MILIDRQNQKCDMQGDTTTIATDIACAAASLKEKLMNTGIDKETAERFITLAISGGFKCIDEEQN